MLLEIPRFKCEVLSSFVAEGAAVERIPAYCFSVTILEARPLLFTVHTQDGALFSRLPICALRHTRIPVEAPPLSDEVLDTWGAISSIGDISSPIYLKDYHVRVRLGARELSGIYLFTIDYSEGGFAQDPEQHKTSNVIALTSGQICAVPNNYCRFLDGHFTSDDRSIPYKRQTIYRTLEA